MANTITKIRTNYVSVTDYNEFERVIKSCVADDDIEITHIVDKDGKTKYAFNVEGDIDGSRDADCETHCCDCESQDDCNEEWSYDNFLQQLQNVIADDDALIITTISYCKMAELHAYAEVITKHGIKALTLQDWAWDTARELLNDGDWTTRDYG